MDEALQPVADVCNQTLSEGEFAGFPLMSYVPPEAAGLRLHDLCPNSCSMCTTMPPTPSRTQDCFPNGLKEPELKSYITCLLQNYINGGDISAENCCPKRRLAEEQSARRLASNVEISYEVKVQASEGTDGTDTTDGTDDGEGNAVDLDAKMEEVREKMKNMNTTAAIEKITKQMEQLSIRGGRSYIVQVLELMQPEIVIPTKPTEAPTPAPTPTLVLQPAPTPAPTDDGEPVEEEMNLSERPSTNLLMIAGLAVVSALAARHE